MDNIIPVNPPTVNKKINPFAHKSDTEFTVLWDPYRLLSHLNTFTPVGTAIVIVAAVK